MFRLNSKAETVGVGLNHDLAFRHAVLSSFSLWGAESTESAFETSVSDYQDIRGELEPRSSQLQLQQMCSKRPITMFLSEALQVSATETYWSQELIMDLDFSRALLLTDIAKLHEKLWDGHASQPLAGHFQEGTSLVAAVLAGKTTTPGN